MNKRASSARPAITLSRYTDGDEKRISQDLLVSQYLEQCFNEKHRKGQFIKTPKYKSEFVKSPYASHVSLRDVGSSKSLLGPHPPNNKRPISAPVYKLGGRCCSRTSSDFNGSFTSGSFISSYSGRSGSKPLYKRKQNVLCVQAYINGLKERSVRVTAADLSQLLVECTHKLGLTSAARKIYLQDGTYVTSEKQLQKDDQIFVSMGEPFKDPFLSIKEREKLRKSSFWTLNGIMMPVEEQRRMNKLSSSVSHRMTQLMESQKRRILIFKNGESFNGVEVIGNRFNEFLDDCTQKLRLTSSARYLYDWSGKTLENLLIVPSLDKSLQPSSGAVLGPLWVSQGERFSPKGAYTFLKTMIQNTKQRIQMTEDYMKQLEEELEIEGSPFAKEEIYAELAEEQITLGDLQGSIPPLKNVLNGLKNSMKEEQASMNPSSFKMKHITEIDSNSRLLVSPGLKLQLYINGQKRDVGPVKLFINLNELRKGAKCKQQIIERLFDLMSSNQNITRLFGVTSRQIFVKRIFTLEGQEITDVDALTQNQELWLSLGECFIPVEYQVMSLSLEKVKILSLWGWKQIVQRDFWIGGDENQTSAKLWQLVPNIPPQCESQEMKLEMSNEQKVAYFNQCGEERLHENRPYLQSKQDHSLVLYPELQIETKGKESSHEENMWGGNIAKWIVSLDGTISNKHFKSCQLGVIDEEVMMILKTNEEEEMLEGAVVGLRMKSNSNIMETQFNGQFCNWIFSPDGYIQPKAFPEYVLTTVSGFQLLENRLQRSPSEEISEEEIKGHWEIKSRNELIVTQHESSSSSDSESDNEKVETEHYGSDNREKGKSKKKNKDLNERQETQQQEQQNFNPFANISDVYKGQKRCLVILPKFPQNHPLAPNQRWAIKTTDENLSMRQDLLPEKWIQQNLQWPAEQSGQISQVNEGFLTYGVPKLKWRNPKTEEKIFSAAKINSVPIKVRVLRNGELDISRASLIMTPDMHNIKSKLSLPVDQKIDGENVVPRSVNLEVNKFLERCTDILNLPFAARRIFTSHGKELTSLGQLEKNDLIYVSCGENWIDPNISHAEQQKRMLLANLASDIQKIKRYLLFRNCAGYILRADTEVTYQEEMKICLMRATMDTNEADNVDEGSKGYELLAPIESDEERPMTSHEKTHARLDSTKQVEKDEDLEGKKSNGISKKQASITHRDALFGPEHQEQTQQAKEDCLFKWVYVDEFIQLHTNPNYVLGINEANPNEEVILMRKQFENSNQRWLFNQDGTISLTGNTNLVLTVATPTKSDVYVEDHMENGVYDQAKLIVASRKALINGNANQTFWLDEESSYIHAFATDDINSELTAANVSAICTFSVFGETPIHQPGYFFKRKEDKQTLFVCEACGKAVRGKQKLQKVAELTEFSCCFGKAKELKLKLKGAFQYLDCQIDLSTLGAEESVQEWENELQRLREGSGVRAMASEISTSQSNPAVRLLVRKNGDCSSSGIMLIGNVLPQILDDCTHKLNLPHAARRLYTLDGELITNMQQLLKPYYPELTYLKKKPKSITPSKVDTALKNVGEDNSDFKQQQQQQLMLEKEQGVELLNIEKLDVRIPVDVWVSMGEPFVPLDAAEKLEILSRYELVEKDDTVKSLQIQKHRLRHAKGRRLASYKSDNADTTLKRAWTTQIDNECQIKSNIGRLQGELEELRSHQKNRAKTLNMNREKSSRLPKKMENMKLYQLPRALRLRVFPNGENPHKCQIVFAQNFKELLDNAGNRLELTSCARRVFSEDGTEVFSMNDLQRDQTLCVTSGERFVPYKERKNQMELKAAYSRVNKPLRTDLNNNEVNIMKHQPSSLVLSETSHLSLTTYSKQVETKDSFIQVVNAEETGACKTSILSRRPKSARMKYQMEVDDEDGIEEYFVA